MVKFEPTCSHIEGDIAGTSGRELPQNAPKLHQKRSKMESCSVAVELVKMRNLLVLLARACTVREHEACQMVEFCLTVSRQARLRKTSFVKKD